MPKEIADRCKLCEAQRRPRPGQPEISNINQQSASFAKITHTKEIYTMYSKTIIAGNVGRDAELRFTPSGVEVADFSLAVNRRWTDRDGNPQERTTWYKVICWRKLAETAAQWIKKGKLILVEGEVEASAFTGKDGEARATLELTANNFKFLGGRRDNGEGEGETGPSVPEIGGDTDIPF